MATKCALNERLKYSRLSAYIAKQLDMVMDIEEYRTIIQVNLCMVWQA